MAGSKVLQASPTAAKDIKNDIGMDDQSQHMDRVMMMMMTNEHHSCPNPSPRVQDFPTGQHLEPIHKHIYPLSTAFNRAM